MAEAYGKLTGKPGICMVTRGPGACHAAIGVHTAAQDSTPMIMLVGQVGRDMLDREAFQEIDYRQMFGPVAKWAAQIDRTDRIPEYIARAFHTATSGRPGPVVLALPEALRPAFTREVYLANFAGQRDISGEDVLARILVALEVEPQPVLEKAGSDEVKAALKAQTDEAIAKGIFGAPSFTVGEELFWGNDRLEQALEWARRNSTCYLHLLLATCHLPLTTRYLYTGRPMRHSSRRAAGAP